MKDGLSGLSGVSLLFLSQSLSMGAQSGYFKSTRGLRQGDPLSPYLFVLGMEVFSILIDNAASGGFLSSFNLIGRTGEEVQVTHLLFADDTLVFCKDSREQLVYLNWILMWFEALSWLKINLSKSALLPAGSVENPESLALELGYKVGCLPTTYLGLPLGAKHNSTRVWDRVEEKFRKRLALWKRQYISKGGRITLIQSTLSNMPIYLMSLFCMPKSVIKRLEKIKRDFLWGGGNLERKLHLVKWKVICLSKDKGGLGIRGLLNLNKAILRKWNWRFAIEDNTLWKDIIRLKYGAEEGGWFS